MGKWADVVLDLLECIEEYSNLIDKVRIRAVCTSWNSRLYPVPKLVSEELPCLLLEDSTTGASLYSVHEAKNYALDLPELKDKVFKGSSYGWIVTLDDENSIHIDDIYAVNPLTRVVLKLPPRSSFPDVQDFNRHRVGHEYIMRDRNEQDPVPMPVPVPVPGNYCRCASKRRINVILTHKVVLSSSPSNDDCLAVAIYGECSWAAWCRPHHKHWTSFEKYNGSGRGVADVIFHKGDLYVLNSRGMIDVYDSIDPQLIVRQVVAPKMGLTVPLYLMACPNMGIVLVHRVVNIEDDDELSTKVTNQMHLYNLVESSSKDGSESWVKVDGIGNDVSFIGLNMSYSISVTDKLKALGYKRNRIYFTQHHWNIGGLDKETDSDVGLFDLDDSYEVLLPGFKHQLEFFWPPPIWVTPTAN